MDEPQTPPAGVRLAELLTCLSLAIDLGTGQPMEWVSRSCLLGQQLAAALGMSVEEQRDVYYLTLLRHLGCTSNSVMDADVFGDELGVAELMTVDFADMPQVMQVFSRALGGMGQPAHQRAETMARVLSLMPSLAGDGHNGHCEAAARLSGAMGFDRHIQDALWQIYERWDGKGTPKQLEGEALLPSIRVIHLAQDAATYYTMGGVEAAVEMARQRAGGMYDPAMVDVFCQHAPDLLACLEVDSAWDAVLAAEPGAAQRLSDAEADTALCAVADFTDLKLPHTRGHSRSVAELVDVAALLRSARIRRRGAAARRPRA